MKYSLAIFDMDGTILNTLDDMTDSLNEILTKYNLPLNARFQMAVTHQTSTRFLQTSLLTTKNTVQLKQRLMPAL